MRDGSEQLFQGNCTLIYGGLNKSKISYIYSPVSTVYECFYDPGVGAPLYCREGR